MFVPQTLPFCLIEQISVAVFHIVQNRFQRDSALFILEILRKRGHGKGIAYISYDISDDPF